ncbi:MAG: hypothetical protein EPO24_02085 [Bacteroidetes bacterium]|nr:MAG: hypothetical protein EPO24_02085 [Bacteroidota bacterium]
MSKKLTYILTVLLLLCYGVTYHVAPVLHHHDIRSNTPVQVTECSTTTSRIADSDSSVCLICLRINSLQVITLDVELFHGMLTTAPLFHETTQSTLLSSDYSLSSPRAPPIA